MSVNQIIQNANNIGQLTIGDIMLKYKIQVFLQRIKKLFPKTLVQFDDFMRDCPHLMKKSRLLHDIITASRQPGNNNHIVFEHCSILMNNGGSIIRSSCQVNSFIDSMEQYLNIQIRNGNQLFVRDLLELEH